MVISGDINGNIPCRIKDKRLTPICLLCDSQDLDNVTIVKVKVFGFGIIKKHSEKISLTFSISSRTDK